MGPADLDKLPERLGFSLQRNAQMSQGWQQQVMDLTYRRHMHHGRKCIIGTLAHIAMIVWMHRIFATHLAVKNFDGPV